MTTPISDLACDRLAAWYSTRATFAVMGEFSSGKSTLLNLLLGEAVLPMQATATSLPPVWFTSCGTGSAGCEALMRDGRMVETDIAAAATSQDPDLLMLRIAHDAPLLDRIDLIDTPGISDPRMAADTLDFIKPFVDFAVWCSAAEQAWRATEAKFWKGCPKHLHASSLLCVTRIDQIAREKDVGRILNRARREAKGLFGEVLGLATLRAIEARPPSMARTISGRRPAAPPSPPRSTNASLRLASGQRPARTWPTPWGSGSSPTGPRRFDRVGNRDLFGRAPPADGHGRRPGREHSEPCPRSLEIVTK